ncbi:hypothetical protein PMAYCL1PPCAC_31450, partial [Pristionchus mayeri]
REKAEPLFWSLYQHHRRIFPHSLRSFVFDGVATIYSLERLNVHDGKMMLEFPVDPPAAATRQRFPPKASATITAVPYIVIDDVFSHDESIRAKMVEMLDLILSQEMRCPLRQNASRFITHGRSLYKVPTTEDEMRLCVKKIGMGEEVWTGLHLAVKADSPDQLFVN